MLDKSKVKRGDIVYRVEWIDLPDDKVGPTPWVQQYKLIGIGPRFSTIQHIHSAPSVKLLGVPGRTERYNTDSVFARHWHTPAEAVTAMMRLTQHNIEDAKRAITRLEEQEKLLDRLAAQVRSKPDVKVRAVCAGCHPDRKEHACQGCFSFSGRPTNIPCECPRCHPENKP